MLSFDANSAECLIFTYKEGLLSPIAHDLKIRVDSFKIELDDAKPPHIKARFDARSLRVVNAMKDGEEAPGDLTDNDRKKIDSETQKAVLSTKRFPEVRFESGAVSAEGEGYRVEGELTLAGKTRRISFPVRRDGSSWLAEVDIHQPDFSIKPYKALLGTLKVKPTLRVRFSTPRDQISMP